MLINKELLNLIEKNEFENIKNIKSSLEMLEESVSDLIKEVANKVSEEFLKDSQIDMVKINEYGEVSNYLRSMVNELKIYKNPEEFKEENLKPIIDNKPPIINVDNESTKDKVVKYKSNNDIYIDSNFEEEKEEKCIKIYYGLIENKVLKENEIIYIKDNFNLSVELNRNGRVNYNNRSLPVSQWLAIVSNEMGLKDKMDEYKDVVVRRYNKYMSIEELMQ